MRPWPLTWLPRLRQTSSARFEYFTENTVLKRRDRRTGEVSVQTRYGWQRRGAAAPARLPQR